MQQARTDDGFEAWKQTAEMQAGAPLVTASYIEALLLSAWLGSMLLFSFGVAPSAFASLPSRHLAGLLVASVLAKVDMIGLIIGPVLILILVLTRGTDIGGKPNRVARLALLILMVASAAISKLVVMPAMTSIRNSFPGPIDMIPAADPSRIEFDRLHQLSVGLMAAAMLSGLVVLFLRIQSWVRGYPLAGSPRRLSNRV
jgi:hypothetical protein